MKACSHISGFKIYFHPRTLPNVSWWVTMCLSWTNAMNIFQRGTLHVELAQVHVHTWHCVFECKHLDLIRVLQNLCNRPEHSLYVLMQAAVMPFEY